MIDVLLPSRERPEALLASIASLQDTSMGIVNILVAADDDDPDTVVAADEAGARVLTFPRQGYDRLHVYYQRLARESLDVTHGDWMLVWNDDATMATRGWDAELYRLPAEILVADIGTPHTPLCCFPAIRREAVETLGVFCSDNPHVDTFWQDIGLATRTIAQVPVYAHHEKAGGPRSSHNGFYDADHQAVLARYAEMIRESR